MQVEDMRLDGNAVGGQLRELFARDVTAAEAKCSACGSLGPIAGLLEYGQEMGVILRCPSCDAVMLRLVRTTNWLRADLSGISLITIHDVAQRPLRQ